MLPDFLCDIVRIRLLQQNENIDDPSNKEQSTGEQIQHTHADFFLIEFMRAVIANENAQQQRDPFILPAPRDHILRRGYFLVRGLILGLRCGRDLFGEPGIAVGAHISVVQFDKFMGAAVFTYIRFHSFTFKPVFQKLYHRPPSMSRSPRQAKNTPFCAVRTNRSSLVFLSLCFIWCPAAT